MSHNVTAKRPTEEYKQIARKAVEDALESTKPYFLEEIRLNGEQESDAEIAGKVRRKVRRKVLNVLFRYAEKHGMLEVTVRRSHKSDPDLLVRRHREPILSDMPGTLTNLDRLIPDFGEMIEAYVSLCRKTVAEGLPEES